VSEYLDRFKDWKLALKGEALWNRPVHLRLACPEDAFQFWEPPPEPEGVIAVAKQAWEMAIATPPPPPPRIHFEPQTPPSVDWVELQLELPGLPKEMSHSFMQQLLWDLTYYDHLAFELIGLGDRIVVQFACDEGSRTKVKSLLGNYFPAVMIREERGFLARSFDSLPPAHHTEVFECGLKQDFAFPISSFEASGSDPLEEIVRALGMVHGGEAAVFQVLFTRADPKWQSGLQRMLDKDEPLHVREVFGENSRGFLRQKVSKHLLSAVIRVAAKTDGKARALEPLLSLRRAVTGEHKRTRGTKGLNVLEPFGNQGWPGDYIPDSHAEHVSRRLCQRVGALYNLEELSSFVHLPLLSHPKLRLLPPQTKSVPSRYTLTEDRVCAGPVLGINTHDGQVQGVQLTRDERTRHTYIVGVSGTGKSTLLFNSIFQDIVDGRGVAVLDPHGDLIGKVLKHLPENRLKDVILFDPSDEEYPIGLNILSAHSELERNLIASDLVAVFRRLSTAWGDQMNAVLANAILAFLESEKGGTLVDLRRFLVDKGFREEFLSSVRDEHIVYYWQKEFPLLSGKPQGPILTRLDSFLRPKAIRHMVMQRENKLDFAKIMNDGRIFLAKLSHGAIGEENSYLLGSLLVSKFQQATMSRQSLPEFKRREFYFYLDEFQHFITPSLASILSGGRKYGLGLILAHQELRQLWTRDEEVASAVLSNPATRVCFRLGEWDAHKMAEGFSFFRAKDLQGLGRGEAICRIDTPEQDFKISVEPWDFLLDHFSDEKTDEKARELSRKTYGTPRSELLPEVKEEHSAPRLEIEPASPPQPEAAPQVEVDPKSTPKRKSASAPAAPKLPAASPEAPGLPVTSESHRTSGKGGPHHRYFQGLIKKLAEEKGYRAEIEKQVLGGTGSIDVALECGEKRIACEISVTTTPDHEIANAQKCLASGYELVALISPYSKTLNQLRKLVAGLEEEAKKRIQFFQPEEFIVFLDTLEAEGATTETVIKGRRIRTNYKALTPEQIEARKKTIAHTIAMALKRMKGK
jgi:hypothetical protein